MVYHNNSVFRAPAYTGATLNAQLRSNANVDVGAVITTGIYEMAGGRGLFAISLDIPNSHDGWCVVYPVGSPTVIVACLPINARELENVDALSSTIPTTLAAVHGAGSWATATGFATPTDIATEQAAITGAIAGVQSDTDNIQTRLPVALVGGKMDSNISGLIGSPGSILFTYTLTDSLTALPLANAEIVFSVDVNEAIIAWVGHTDSFGIARDIYGQLPKLDPGTYYVWRRLIGYIFSDPDIEVVS